MSNDMRAKLEFIGIIFAVGMAWGTLTLQVRDVSTTISQMQNRITKIEGYMVQQTKGQFVP